MMSEINDSESRSEVDQPAMDRVSAKNLVVDSSVEFDAVGTQARARTGDVVSTSAEALDAIEVDNVQGSVLSWVAIVGCLWLIASLSAWWFDDIFTWERSSIERRNSESVLLVLFGGGLGTWYLLSLRYHFSTCNRYEGLLWLVVAGIGGLSLGPNVNEVSMLVAADARRYHVDVLGVPWTWFHTWIAGVLIGATIPSSLWFAQPFLRRLAFGPKSVESQQAESGNQREWLWRGCVLLGLWCLYQGVSATGMGGERTGVLVMPLAFLSLTTIGTTFLWRMVSGLRNPWLCLCLFSLAILGVTSLTVGVVAAKVIPQFFLEVFLGFIVIQLPMAWLLAALNLRPRRLAAALSAAQRVRHGRTPSAAPQSPWDEPTLPATPEVLELAPGRPRPVTLPRWRQSFGWLVALIATGFLMSWTQQAASDWFRPCVYCFTPSAKYRTARTVATILSLQKKHGVRAETTQSDRVYGRNLAFSLAVPNWASVIVNESMWNDPEHRRAIEQLSMLIPVYVHLDFPINRIEQLADVTGGTLRIDHQKLPVTSIPIGTTANVWEVVGGTINTTDFERTRIVPHITYHGCHFERDVNFMRAARTSWSSMIFIDCTFESFPRQLPPVRTVFRWSNLEILQSEPVAVFRLVYDQCNVEFDQESVTKEQLERALAAMPDSLGALLEITPGYKCHRLSPMALAPDQVHKLPPNLRSRTVSTDENGQIIGLGLFTSGDGYQASWLVQQEDLGERRLRWLTWNLMDSSQLPGQLLSRVDLIKIGSAGTPVGPGFPVNWTGLLLAGDAQPPQAEGTSSGESVSESSPPLVPTVPHTVCLSEEISTLGSLVSVPGIEHLVLEVQMLPNPGLLAEIATFKSLRRVTLVGGFGISDKEWTMLKNRIVSWSIPVDFTETDHPLDFWSRRIPVEEIIGTRIHTPPGPDSSGNGATGDKASDRDAGDVGQAAESSID